MKTIISKTLLVVLFTLSILSLNSCEKNKDKKLDVHFDYKVGSETFNYNQVYTINGTAVEFSLVQFYVSGITLMDDASNMTMIEDKHLLVKAEQQDYEVGVVPENFGSHLHMFNFSVGVDPATDSQSESDFTSRDSDDPLSAQSPAMHWGGTSGYIFLRIDARVDTSADGIPDTDAEFHIGTDNLLRAPSIMTHRDLEAGDNKLVLNFDVATLFDGVDINTAYSTQTIDNMPLATTIADNLTKAFSKAN